MEKLFSLGGLDELRSWAYTHVTPDMREMLLAEFAALCEYRSAEDWNRLVRVCEALALVGWGDATPVEAVAERWINGRIYTRLQTAQFSSGWERGWITHQGLLVLDEPDPYTDGAEDHLDSQRVHLPKNPLRLTRIGDEPREAVGFVAHARRLRDLFDTGLARSYGDGFDYLWISLIFSTPDAGPGRAEEYFHDQADLVERDGVRSYVRPRLEIGRLSRRQGETMLRFTRHYTVSEVRTSPAMQCAGLADDLREMIDLTAARLRRRAPGYRADLLRSDADAILYDWLSSVV